MFQFNPSSFGDEFQDKLKDDESVADQEKERILEMAALMGNSSILRSYE